MLIVEAIAKIRRLFFVQGKPIKAICRELRLSEGRAEGCSIEEEAQPLPKIGPWSDKLDQLLLTNEAKVARERLMLIRLFEESLRQAMGQGARAIDGGGLCPVEPCSG